MLPEKIAELAGGYDAVIFTLDWHPANHCSFAEQGGIWPSHCVAYTQGAGLPDCFAPILRSGKAQLYLKGCDAGKEQYGAFECFEGYETVKAWLEGAQSVDVCGIAGDYCVKESTANILKVVPASKVSILCGCVRSIDGGEALDAFIAEKGYRNDFSESRLHHEIYISDPRKTPVEKRKTVIRHPIAKI